MIVRGKILMEVLCSFLIKNITFNKVMLLVTRVIAIKNTFYFMGWYVLPSNGFNW